MMNLIHAPKPGSPKFEPYALNAKFPTRRCRPVFDVACGGFGALKGHLSLKVYPDARQPTARFDPNSKSRNPKTRDPCERCLGRLATLRPAPRPGNSKAFAGFRGFLVFQGVRLWSHIKTSFEGIGRAAGLAISLINNEPTMHRDHFRFIAHYL